ncbi:MBOAT family O-acyltransferase [Mesorhizobium sp. M00.F.Ca.ET.216.01.1.1]|uniref:MBOAT family O-acyltransferase n=1 Tax=Mesorhizobium sp. M00.F.Ca.ET.216.01.1.1 TaxID=2500528 RepID=UPI000FD6E0A9|nr:MBOAT family O-acyltransferase [Mesorhizobium sp. M00.F.Ca.ET.216.01.1.1]TGQ47839.1 MBOAT family protein [Mesorhizobium sp. M00.F.Ca.ET.216.01.1.1]TIS92121.1 MAG: MBOAT family protein [Mesorhizobium sp.]TJW17891.1 MAG: MBOAT family protein [Mesorhizobium sp.]TJW46870.1 MAG: MBOAT family protein [Mesorhizobium sp.]
MLFNSAIFLLGLLPIALAGFFALGLAGRRKLAIVWLTLISLVFYGWWNVAYVPLLLASIVVNYAVGAILTRRKVKSLLIAGITLNLLLLGYYKYAGFLVVTVSDVLDLGLPVPTILLPLAISFFTFQQIAYLADAYEDVAAERSFANYCLFITFFPHLIAGPITHHKEMMPQFDDARIFKPQPQMLALGGTVFVVGLFKKVIIADTIALWANPVFAAAGKGDALQMFEAWGGALSYMLQIYFDFSGYSDMAIGLGMLFGIRLPFNFNSPLKARNIIDFWSRWHMTLTRFVTAYIYNPLSLSLTRRWLASGTPGLRRGKTSPAAFAVLLALPTILAMVIIGLWHGAGWQFAAFGLVHGLFLTINHGWRMLKMRWQWRVDSDRPIHFVPSVLMTMGCVMVGLVFFRSPDLATAFHLLRCMAGFNGLGFHSSELLDWDTVQLQLLLLTIVWFLPNVQEWLRRYETGLGQVDPATWLDRKLRLDSRMFALQPTPAFAVVTGLIGFLAVTRTLSAAPTMFLYFQF